MDSIRVSEAADTGSIPVEATFSYVLYLSNPNLYGKYSPIKDLGIYKSITIILKSGAFFNTKL